MKFRLFAIGTLFLAGISLVGCNKGEGKTVNALTITMGPSQPEQQNITPTNEPMPDITEDIKPEITVVPSVAPESNILVTPSSIEIKDQPTISLQLPDEVEQSEDVYIGDNTVSEDQQIFADETRAYLNDKETVAEIFISNHEITITGIICSSKNTIRVPAKIDGMPVVTIGEGAFSNVDAKEVILENGISQIGNQAFYRNETISQISIPKSVTTIGSNAFGECSKLSMIRLDTGNEDFSLMNGVLFNKEMSKLIRYPSGRRAESYIVPSGIVSVEDGAFSMASNLKYITLPDSIRSIGREAFAGCTQIDIELPSKLIEIGSFAFADCYGLRQVTIPSGVKYIEEGAFSGCERLKRVMFRGDIKEIGYAAFSNCTALTGVEINGTIQNIGVMAFAFCSQLKSIQLPEGTEEVSDMAFYNCTELCEITLPHSVTYFGSMIFDGTKNLIIIAPKWSGAYNYATENGLIYQES